MRRSGRPSVTSVTARGRTASNANVQGKSCAQQKLPQAFQALLFPFLAFFSSMPAALLLKGGRE
jgi:hypothetical protein